MDIFSSSWPRIILLILFCPILLFLSGCATIINSPTQKVPVTSTPSGAKLTVDGNQSYTTPTELQLKRKQDHTLFFQKEGYEDLTFVLKHVLSGAVAGNIIAGGLIGWGVDAASGSQNKLIPETVNVTLTQVSTDQVSSAPSITSKLDELDQLLKEKRVSQDEYNKLKQNLINDQGR